LHKFVSTKTYGHEVGLSTCFRQWRAESHCGKLHGYALSIRFEFEAETLDENNWVVDFGGLKGLKEILVDLFDHTLLVAHDDPNYYELRNLGMLGLAKFIEVEATGCEAFAKLVYEIGEQWLNENGYSPRCILKSVEVREHGANSAIYKRS
jgi:6-pyruvoyltetrahydropterin/6-carboxytetrahydropterin synthase